MAESDGWEELDDHEAVNASDTGGEGWLGGGDPGTGLHVAATGGHDRSVPCADSGGMPLCCLRTGAGEDPHPSDRDRRPHGHRGGELARQPGNTLLSPVPAGSSTHPVRDAADAGRDRLESMV